MRNRLSKDDAFRLIFSQSQQKETDKNHTHATVPSKHFEIRLHKSLGETFLKQLCSLFTCLRHHSLGTTMIVVVLDIVARRGAAKIITPENGSIFTICLGHSANVAPQVFYSPLNCPRFSVQKTVAYSILPGKHPKKLRTNLGNQMTIF